MENLITILQSNGTGLLKGLCRPTQYDEFEETPHRDGPLDELLMVVFSLNEKNLGTFGLIIDDCCVADEAEKDWQGYYSRLRTDELSAEHKEIFIEIYWGVNSDFGYFKATLQFDDEHRNNGKRE